MGRFFRIQAVANALLMLVIAMPMATAAEVELSAATKTPGANPKFMSYRGDVTLKVPAGTQMQLHARGMKRERGLEIVHGEVEIKLDTMIVRTEQASIARNDQFTLVKMDAAEVTSLAP